MKILECDEAKLSAGVFFLVVENYQIPEAEKLGRSGVRRYSKKVLDLAPSRSVNHFSKLDKCVLTRLQATCESF